MGVTAHDHRGRDSHRLVRTCRTLDALRPFTIVETDGNPVPPTARIDKDVVNVGPGERYDVIWKAREPGRWLLHCHIPHHTTNDNVEENGGGGLTMIINVTQ